MNFKFPDVHNRVSIMGATGSGKTRFGIWLFAMSSHFKKRPYVIIDFKGDDLLAQIENAREIGLGDRPKHPGLYILRPKPHQQEEVNKWLWGVWERGNTGLFFDEGYMIKKTDALEAILTQGRSLKIPAMVLTQRPAWCNRFIFSEASYYSVFRMNDERDFDTIRGFTPRSAAFDFSTRLPDFTCRWYDVARNWSAIIDPVPGDEFILELYYEALRVKHRGI